MSHSAKSATPVSKELVLLLSKDHDLKTTAKLTGLSYDNVRQIVSRHDRKQASHSVTIPSTASQQVAEVRNRAESELSDNDRETRLSLSRYARKASQKAESKGLKDAPIVHKLAQTAAIVGDWRSNKDNDQASVAVNIAILSV